jgi:AraC-like DNA-binding protein
MKNRVYVKFLISYLLVFLFPLCFSVIAYNQSLKVAESGAQEFNMTSLIRCRETIDGRIIQTENLANQLSQAAATSDLVFGTSPYRDQRTIIKMMDFQETLKSYIYTDDSVKDLFIFFKRPKVVVGSSILFLSFDEFYGNYFTYAGMDAAEWDEKITNGSYKRVFLPTAQIKRYTASDNMLIYAQSFPFGLGSLGNIVALIPEEVIRATVKNSYLSKYGWFFITDSDGRQMFSYNNGLDLNLPDTLKYTGDSGFQHINVNGEKFLVSYTVSPSTRWRYVGILPDKVVMQKVDGLRFLIYTIIALCVFIGVILMVLLAYRNSRHVQSLASIFLNKLNISYSGRKQEVEIINSSLTGILTDNQELKHKMERQLPMLRNTFVERLLKRDFKDKEEIDWLISQLGLPGITGRKIVVAVEADTGCLTGIQGDLAKFNTAKILVRNSLMQNFANLYYYTMDFDKDIFILGIHPVKEEELEDELNRILRNLGNAIFLEHGITLLFSVGTVFEDFTDAVQSYDAALEAMSYSLFLQDRNVIWYQDVNIRDDRYYYPLELEMRILNYVKDSNTGMIDETFDRIYKENFVKRNLSAFMMKSLVNEIYSTLIKTADMLKLDRHADSNDIGGRILNINRNAKVEKVFADFKSILKDVCLLVRMAKPGSKTSKMMEDIVKYLEVAYMDHELNMTITADRFGFTPPYLSRAFKEYTGEVFSVYLENLRIKKACELLLEGETVENVSFNAGYNCVNAFRKAFKRIIGVTPSEFRYQRRQAFHIIPEGQAGAGLKQG